MTEIPWQNRCTVMGEMLVAGTLTEDYAARQVERAKRLNCDVLFFFIQNEGYALWKSRIVPRFAELRERDLLRELTDEAHRRGLKFVAAWYGMHCQTLQSKEHPEWQRVNRDGVSDTWVLCLNSPFRRYLLEQVREVLTSYEVDGIYFDGVYASPGYCYCPHCREKFRQLHASEMPEDAWDPRMREFRFDTCAGFARDVRRYLNETGCEVVFVMDTHGAIIGYADAGEPLERYGPYVDALVLECYWEVIREPVYYVGMEARLVAAEARKPVWSPRWIARNPDRDYVPIPAAQMKLWAFEALLNGSLPFSLQQGAFQFSQTGEQELGEALGHARQVLPLLAQSKPLKHTALLHSLATKEHHLPSRPRQMRQHFEGFYAALLEHHIPFEVVTENDVLAGDLSEFGTLVLPNTYCLGDEVAEGIGDYVSRGGGLVVTYLTGFADEKGQPREQLALAELAGVRLNNLITRGAAGHKEPTNYYQASSDHPLVSGIPEGVLSYHGSFIDAQLEPDVKAVVHLRDFDWQAQTGGAYFGWFPGSPSHPLIVTREAGGRIVYLLGELDAAFWQSGWPEAGQLLANAVKWAGGRDLPYEVEAPGTVSARGFVTDDGTCMAFLFANRTTNQLYANGFPGAFVDNPQSLGRTHFVREVIPVSGVTVRVRVGDRRTATVHTVTGRRCDFTVSDGWLMLRLPTLLEYEAMLIEFAE